MKVNQVAIELLSQLKAIAISLSDDDFSKPIGILSNSSIGAHNRHSLEFFQMLKNGIENGLISYDKRIHNKELEYNTKLFSDEVENIVSFLQNLNTDKEISLEVSYPLNDIYEITNSTVQREIVYNIEHLVHHMAIIKIGITQEFPDISLPENFGVAQSTVVHKNSEIKA